jgi:lipoprotein-anchoring transpeptidase ErfK/SrfK
VNFRRCLPILIEDRRVTLTRSHRRLIVGVLFVAALLGVAVAAAIAYDHGRKDRLAPGIRIGGVDVGGLSVNAARERLQRRAVEARRRDLHVRVAGRQFTLPATRSRVTVDLQPALDQALSDSRRGWFGARVQRELTKQRTDESIAVTAHYARGVVPALVKKIAAAVGRAPVDATVKPAASGLSTTASHDGRALNTARLKKALAGALVNPARPADIAATTRTVAPKTTSDELAARYPAYIVVDRKSHVLRFFQHLKLSRTYPIAVGKSGLETPTGLYDVQWKQTNPSWYVPNSAWAGKLAGTTVPPGPNNPIQARWMAFDGGAGIHGIMPSEYSSIGHDASHGCVRMRIPDVISLYARTPVHTPVFIA